MGDGGNWIEAGVDGVQFGLARYVGTPDRDGSYLGVFGRSGFSAAARTALVEMGFRPSNENANLYGRPGERFDLGEMRRAFPSAAAVAAAPPEPRRLDKAAPFGFAPPRSAAAPPPAGDLPQSQPARPRVAPGRGRPLPAVPGAALPPGPPPGAAAPAVHAEAERPPEARPAEQAAPRGAAAGPPAPAKSAPPAAAVKAPAKPAAKAESSASSRAGRPTIAPPAAELRKVDIPAFEGMVAGQINPFQMTYEPASQVGKPIAAIPINLAEPTARALARVVGKYGDIDKFVAKRLRWSVKEMVDYLSPEQVDAVALAIASAERGQGFVLADQTGLGKGRVVAAICRAVVIAGKPAIFITEKQNLFSDLWRDIVDINSADLFGRPFMLNNDAKIVDGSTAEAVVVHEPWEWKDVKKFVRTKKLPKGCKLAMATYSQFNRPGSTKAEWLKAVAAGRHLLCDESHNAVGDSNTSLALSAAMDGAAAVTYSSATFARHAANLAAYKRLFPASMRSTDLMEVLTTGGQAISEALSQMLAEDGAYLRREHDLSGLTIEVIDDVARLDRNRGFADALSPILARVAKLSRHVSEIVDSRNNPDGDDEAPRPRKGGKEFWTAGNFGSRLGLIVRQFVTALKVDLCIEKSIAALEAGEKPVIVVESTMESLMRELASDGKEADEAMSDLAAIEAADAVETGAVEALLDDEASVEMLEGAAEATVKMASAPNPPTFADALRLLVDRTMQISVRRGKADPEKAPVDEPELVAEAESIKRLVEDFPQISLSPIDDVRDGIERASRRMVAEGRLERPWVVEEISARGLRVVEGVYEQRVAPERVKTVARFQGGMSDGIILTRAASTGLSLHADGRAKDQRKRLMIELQIPSNVVERVQFWGRVKRRGQVCEPGFMTLTSGLEMEIRQLANDNRKVADLSANVTASAASATAMKVPGLIDPVGNAVAKRILEEQPKLPDDMHIAMKLKDMETAEAEFYHVHKLLQRLVLLPSAEQSRVYAELVAAYEDQLREMKARGKGQRGARELEGVWRLVSRETFEPGDPRDGEVFGRPVTLTTAESRRDLNPLSFDAVAALVEKGNARLAAAARGGEPFAAHLKELARRRPTLLAAAIPKRHSEFFINYDQALRAAGQNPVKAADDRIRLLTNFIRVARPGSEIAVVGEEGTEMGVIVDVRPPYDLEFVHQPGRWVVRYVVPGDEAPREISASAQASRDGGLSLSGHDAMTAYCKRRFDAAPRGATVVRRRLLDGNPVRAVVSARKAGWGAMATWRGEDGRLNRGMLVPKNCPLDLDAALTGRTGSTPAALAVLRAGAVLWTNPDRIEGGAVIEEVAEAGRRLVRIEVPSDKRLMAPFNTDAMRALVGPWLGTQLTRYAMLPVERARLLLDLLTAQGHAFNYDGQYRRVAHAVLSAPQAAEPEPEEESDGPRMR